MTEKKDHDVVIRMDKMKVLTGLVIIVLVLTAVNLYSNFDMNKKLDSITAGSKDIVKGEPTAAEDTQPSPSANQPQPSQPSKVDVSTDDDPSKGSENAPVTIIEFSDFECPFCGRFFTQTLPQIEENYINDGKVRLVYRDFPLGFHPQAQKAAEAAECADEQGKFWEMHDKLFEDGVSGGVGSFKQYAEDLGLDTAKFNDCLDSGAMASEVQNDMQDGQSAGVSGTPTFFINGQKVVGAQPFSAFENIIDSELLK